MGLTTAPETDLFSPDELADQDDVAEASTDRARRARGRTTPSGTRAKDPDATDNAIPAAGGGRGAEGCDNKTLPKPSLVPLISWIPRATTNQVPETQPPKTSRIAVFVEVRSVPRWVGDWGNSRKVEKLRNALRTSCFPCPRAQPERVWHLLVFTSSK
jgi:hypothetical protein